MPALVLLALLSAAVLAPAVLEWLQVGPIRPWRDEAGGALALLGFAALALDFLLSGRFRMISAGPGIDRTMRWHQRAGRILAAMLLLHPFLYTLPDGPAAHRPNDPGHLAWLGLDGGAILTGMLAWFLLGLLVITAMRRDDLPYRYETWRAAHGLCAPATIGLGLHHALTAGRNSAHPAVMAALWALSALALGTMIWSHLLRPLALLGRAWRIVSVRQAARATWELVLEPVGHAGLQFQAGQFAWLKLDRGPFALREHPFSIAYAPCEGPRLRFLVKELGDFTRTIGTLRPGVRAFTDGPHGLPHLDRRTAPGIVFLCGGVGIAPALSMLGKPRGREAARP